MSDLVFKDDPSSRFLLSGAWISGSLRTGSFTLTYKLTQEQPLCLLSCPPDFLDKRRQTTSAISPVPTVQLLSSGTCQQEADITLPCSTRHPITPLDILTSDGAALP